jgi:enoyl-CoA hydratase
VTVAYDAPAIAVITIDNPPFNAFHPAVGEMMAACIDEVAGRPDVRCVVLTGAGKYFMAGGDIKFIGTLESFVAERYVLRIQEVQDQLRRLPQPVIAALNGTALGGGLELAMACDIRVAAEGAAFGLPEVSLGIIPGAGGTQHLPRLVPLGQAKRLLFTADRIPAAEAQAIGLVDFVVPDQEVRTASMDIAKRIAANAPLAVTAAKRAVDLGMQASVIDGLRLEATLFAPLVASEDFKEAITAFFEHRPSNFARR